MWTTNSEMHAMTSAEAIATPNEQCEILTPQSRDASTADLVPEKRLMLAVLESAVNDFRTYTMVATGRGSIHPRPARSISRASARRPDWILASSGAAWQLELQQNAEVALK